MPLIRLFILAAAFTAAASLLPAAQWPEDPAVNQAVVMRPGDQALPKSAPTSDGGAWVAWFDNASGNYDVYIQRYDNKGFEAGPAGGILVSGNPQSSSLVNWDLIADSSDNAVLVFTDTRSGGDLDVYAYRIASNGAQLWGPNGVALSPAGNTEFEADPMVTEATNGDFVVSWNYLPSGAGQVRLQRISPAGVPLLAAGGVIAAAQAGESPGFADLVPGPAGSVIVSWVRDIGIFSSVKFIRAQRFNTAGAPVWAAPVEVFDAWNIPIAYLPQILSDGAGGAVFAWHASNPGTNLFECFVQRVSPQGVERFAHNGVVLSGTATTNHLSPTASFDPATGEIFAFWLEKNSAQSQSGLFAQKVDALGALQWGLGGTMLLPVDGNTKFPPRSAAFGGGATAFLTWEPTATFGQNQILAYRVDNNGADVWAGGSRLVSSILSGKSVRLGLATDAVGETVVFWEDDRNGTDDIYGQNLHPEGTLGESCLSTNLAAISLSAGGTQVFTLDGGLNQAGKRYWMLGTLSGTSPGVPAKAKRLPLNDDNYFRLTLNNPGNPLFGSFRGTLDAAGMATASVTVPAGFRPGLAGRTVHHAYLLLSPTNQVDRVSNSEPLLLQP